MIPVVSADFLLDSPWLGRRALEVYARSLFEDLDRFALERLPFEDYSFHLEVEEGSLKGKARYLAPAKYFFAGKPFVGMTGRSV